MRAASEGRSAATYGWSFAKAAWSGFGAESVSKVADNLATSRSEATAGDYAGAVIDVVTLGKGGGAVIAGKIFGPKILSKLKGLIKAPKGLTTPKKYFGNKTYKEAEKALTDKFGPPRGGGKYNKSFYNERTKRTYNLHQDPSHRGGKPHIDTKKRDLPNSYYKDRPFFLKEGN